MYSSNGVSCIAETEALLGDLMKESFPHDGSHGDYHRAKARFMDWVGRSGLRTLSFWDYIAFKKTSPGLHLAPSPFIGLDYENRYIVFDKEIATKVLALGFLPDKE
jgi:hypothetical protein